MKCTCENKDEGNEGLWNYMGPWHEDDCPMRGRTDELTPAPNYLAYLTARFAEREEPGIFATKPVSRSRTVDEVQQCFEQIRRVLQVRAHLFSVGDWEQIHSLLDQLYQRGKHAGHMQR